MKINYQNLPTHILQSKEWGDFKTKMGTPAIRVGKIQFTLHNIPLTDFNIGYSPKIDPTDINWKELKRAGQKNKCIAINFDVPNIIKLDNGRYRKVEKEFKSNCVKSPRNTFAKWNILLDISKPEEELLKSLHRKTRYNVRLAKRKGVIVREESNEKGIAIFNKLNRETAKRQKFFIHSDKYYEEVFKTLNQSSMANILVAYFGNEPLVAYILLNYKDVLYYPYGASSDKHRNLMAANLIMWESIKFGKDIGCRIFDMWGAAKNDSDKNWWGFTRFKLGYGGKRVEFMESYDLVLNTPAYRLFNIADSIRWGILNLKKLI